MSPFFRILFVFLSILYPLLVFTCLVLLKVPVKVFSLFIVFIGLLYLLIASSGKKNTSMSLSARLKQNSKLLISSVLLLVGGIVCLISGQSIFIKFYPAAMSAIFLFTFASTLFIGPNMCFRFACISDKSLADSPLAKPIEKYCLKVTIIWCIFFILNGSAAVYTVLCQNDKIWSIYNGGISYVLMGMLFAIEFVVRIFAKAKMAKKYKIAENKDNKMEENKLSSTENKHGIPGETIISKNEDENSVEVILKLFVPASSDYFDGHFPQFKLLPAVAQIDLVAHFAHRYFGTKIATNDIKRFKFSDKLLPDSEVKFNLKFDKAKSRVTFDISDMDDSRHYASGSYLV